MTTTTKKITAEQLQRFIKKIIKEQMEERTWADEEGKRLEQLRSEPASMRRRIQQIEQEIRDKQAELEQLKDKLRSGAKQSKIANVKARGHKLVRAKSVKKGDTVFLPPKQTPWTVVDVYSEEHGGMRDITTRLTLKGAGGKQVVEVPGGRELEISR